MDIKFNLHQSVVIGCAVVLSLALVTPASATPVNLVQNGSFENTTLTNTGYFNQFSPAYGGTGASNVAHWTVNCGGTLYPANAGSCAPGDPLLVLVVPTTSTTGFSPGNGLYGPGANPSTTPVPKSPDGGNFVAEDGNAELNVSFSQQISGLVPGKDYAVSFYQAASQQIGLSGATTEQWQVSLGSEIEDSTLMHNPSESFTPWSQQILLFTASSTSEALTFLALGSPAGLPPIALLDGVSVTAVPEPAFLAVAGLGLVGVFAFRRRKK
jgi:hypothetical protein